MQLVDWNPDGKWIASDSSDITVKVWDALTGHEVITLTGHQLSVRSVDWNHDGACLALSNSDGVTIVWDARRGCGQEEIELSTIAE